MIETNVRLVGGGCSLTILARVAQLVTQVATPDLAEKVCSRLRNRHSLAAVRNDNETLLVVSEAPLKPMILSDQDFLVEVRDTGNTRRLHFDDPHERQLIASLVERLVLAAVAKRTDLWSIVASPRSSFEQRPFRESAGVAAHRRYDVSAVPLADIGIGISVDVGTAFFTLESVADFFRGECNEQERKRRRARFDQLAQRQEGRKGTLLYDRGVTKHRCYFERFLDGVTLGSSGKLRINGKDHDSLFEYYTTTASHLRVTPSDSVALVSFPGIDRPQSVAAKLLKLRVGTDSLPHDLRHVDKLSPEERTIQIESFFEQLGQNALSAARLRLDRRLWCPPREKVQCLVPPSLRFSSDTLNAPMAASAASYCDYYRRRGSLMDKGCLVVPPTVARRIYFALPTDIADSPGAVLVEEMMDHLARWTMKPIEPEVVDYSRIEDAIAELKGIGSSGAAVFVFRDDNPVTYYRLARELRGWRIKRIRERSLVPYADVGRIDPEFRPKRWKSLTRLSALDVLQLIGCIPWSHADALNYEAQLGIDVGEDRRHFALSLLLSRSGGRVPDFRLDTIVDVKVDSKNDAINPRVLRDKILQLFDRMPSRFDPVKSLLVLRDGREVGHERNGIEEAVRELRSKGLLSEHAILHVVDFHKRSAKNIRIWDRQAGRAEHALQGQALVLDSRTCVVATTGAPTLRQGTAEPLLLVARDAGVDIFAVANDVFAAAQLNWSSPQTGQRLPITLKRTDEALQARAAQEIRGIT